MYSWIKKFILATIVSFGSGFVAAPPAQAVDVFFLRMVVNDCNEIGTCDWKLSCGLGNQTETEFFSMAEANTNEDVTINRLMSQGALPVLVHCTAQEHDGGIGAEWEQVGSGSVVANVPGNYMIRLNQHRDEGDVTVLFTVSNTGTTQQGLSGGRPNWRLAPNYGTVQLRAGFLPDPHVRALLAGGSLNAASLGGRCVGWITRRPDYRLSWTAGPGGRPLIFTVRSAADTTLVVNDASGNWHCDDDGGGNFDPMIRFNAPRSGQYDIWIGTYHREGGFPPADLRISEVPGW